MDKYTKAVLAVVALSVFAFPLKAEEKVWYCEMTGVAMTTIDGADTYKTERFRMKVTPESVVFAATGVLNDLDLQMIKFFSVDYFIARDTFDRLIFKDNVLNYAIVVEKFASAVTAHCDDF